MQEENKEVLQIMPVQRLIWYFESPARREIKRNAKQNKERVAAI
jgi:hypothetical protein